PTFLDFVEYLAGRLGDAPVLLLCLGRPELAERRPAWLREPATAVVLEPLTEADSERLLEALGVTANVRPRIAAAAEGTPLFVEQLAALADDHAGEMPGSIRGVPTSGSTGSTARTARCSSGQPSPAAASRSRPSST